ncbi:MAG TPA: flagellar hook-associated protein FlgK, partial [bacterium]|nr:flagellar hook-associated protein FlgK [bacterium]
MSLFNSIQGLGSTMNVFQYGEQVISENIANASVPGYALQTLDISSIGPTNQDGLLLGSGVQATGVANTRNVYLDNQLRLELGGLGYNNARLSGLQQIAALFPEVANASATSGLQGAIANLSSAWSALAASPNSVAAKSTVLGDMQTLSGMFNTDAQQLFSLQENLNTQVNNEITTINGLLDQVVTLNKEISLGSTGQVDGQPNVLVDQREQVAEQLAQALGANSTVNASGNMVVTFSGGTLADGNNAYHLEAIPSSTAVGFTGVGYQQIPVGTPAEVTSMITSGTLGGLLTSRDTDVKTARLALDKMAYGIINYSNQINDTFVAADGSDEHDLFIGTKAADMEVSAAITNPGGLNYIGGTRNSDPNTTAGDLATMQAAMQSMDMYQTVATDLVNQQGGIDPTVAIGAGSQPWQFPPSGLALPGNPGVLMIQIGNQPAVPIQWNVTQSLDTIISNINAAGGGAFYATFDASDATNTANGITQAVKIFSTAPLTVWDQSGNLGKTLMLSSTLTSSASMNNSPLALLGQMKPNQPMNNAVNMANVFTQELTGLTPTGTAIVDGNSFNWTPGNSILQLTQGIIPGASPTLSGGFYTGSQTAFLVRSGAQNINPGLLTAGNPMTPISISDSQGNLTQVLNLADGSSNAS